MKKIVVAITGASGAPVGVRLVEALLEAPGTEVSLVVSDSARATLRIEAGIDLGKTAGEADAALSRNFGGNGRLVRFEAGDMAARISSGSHPTAAMIIAPCSMSTLAAIAHGVTMNLIHRAASVMLKERRPLILVPRESPLSQIHLRNMLILARAGAHLVPATLAFYSRPRNIQDLVDFTCARVLDLAGVPHRLSKRWEGEGADALHPRIQGYLE